MTEWKQIDDTNYEISNTGMVRNITTKNILKQTAKARHTAQGHPYYRTHISGTTKRTRHIHVEMAKAFIPNPENKKYVDHIDGDSLNNTLSNLRWATPQENTFNAKCYSNNLLNIKGVQKRENGRYRARIRHNGILINIGHYDTLEEARQAYINKANELFGEFSSVRT